MSDDNQHSKFAPSSMARLLSCPASLQMQAGEPDESSPFAEEGTAAHELAEIALSNGQRADYYLGDTSENGYLFDEDMAEEVQKYVQYVDNIRFDKRDGQESITLIEQKVDLSKWVNGCWGTADTIVRTDDILHVIDLKYGKGVKVDAAWNKQLMTYALGALDKIGIDKITKVFMHIGQPRLNHFDKFELSTLELLAFAMEMQRGLLQTQRQAPDFNPSSDNCRFCKAKAKCKPLADYNIKVAQMEFDNDGFKGMASIHEDYIPVILKNKALIVDWLKAIEDQAKIDLTHGKKIEGYKLVQSVTRRKWRNDKEAEKFLVELVGADAYKTTPITPAQAEKKIKALKDLEVLNALREHIVKPEGKPTIAKESDKREALNLSAKDDFKE
jgi:hypothetical protein